MIWSMSSSVSDVKRIVSSRRLRNSGLNARLTSDMTMSSTLAGIESECIAKPDALALLEVTRTEVRRHDDDRVLEVDRVAEAIGQLAVFKHLQQDVVDIRVRLLDFIEQDDRVGWRFTRSVSWPPSS